MSGRGIEEALDSNALACRNLETLFLCEVMSTVPSNSNLNYLFVCLEKQFLSECVRICRLCAWISNGGKGTETHPAIG